MPAANAGATRVEKLRVEPEEYEGGLLRSPGGIIAANSTEMSVASGDTDEGLSQNGYGAATGAENGQNTTKPKNQEPHPRRLGAEQDPTKGA